MAENTIFKMDFTEFDRNFLQYALTKAPEAADKGMFRAVSELKNDADTVEPKTPHLEGALRGTFDISHKIESEAIIGQLVFMMPYAARWHEAENNIDPITGSIVHWSESGVGPKYVESKLVRFMKKYIGIVADTIKELSR